MEVSAEGLYSAARERFANRDYYGALLCLEEVVAAGREYADVFHLRGLCYSMLDRPLDALAEFDHALTLNPRYVEAHLHRGILLNQLGRHTEAGVAFEVAAAVGGPAVAGLSAPIAARLANEHARLGDMYAEAGALLEAVGEYRRAVELGPGYHDLRLRLARLLVQAGNPLQAREELERILGARPEWIEARIQLGLSRYLAGDVAGAREVWRACLADQPGHELVRAYLAMADRIAS